MDPRIEEMKSRGLKDLDYLGDGVYAGHDGLHVVLFLLEAGHFGTDAIALEGSVLESLRRYTKRVGLISD